MTDRCDCHADGVCRLCGRQQTEDVRQALNRLVLAVDALHASDDVVRELVRSRLNVELCLAVAAAVGVLDATAV